MKFGEWVRMRARMKAEQENDNMRKSKEIPALLGTPPPEKRYESRMTAAGRMINRAAEQAAEQAAAFGGRGVTETRIVADAQTSPETAQNEPTGDAAGVDVPGTIQGVFYHCDACNHPIPVGKIVTAVNALPNTKRDLTVRAVAAAFVSLTRGERNLAMRSLRYYVSAERAAIQNALLQAKASKTRGKTVYDRDMKRAKDVQKHAGGHIDAAESLIAKLRGEQTANAEI